MRDIDNSEIPFFLPMTQIVMIVGNKIPFVGKYANILIKIP
jgi:hypothetical protein